MSIRRPLVTIAIFLTIAGSLRAQSVDLTEAPLVDNFFRVELTMKLSGKTKFQQAGKTLERPVSAEARHDYAEKILDAVDGIVTKTVRDYKVAEAVLKFGDTPSKRAFQPGHGLLVSQRLRGQTITYCPKGSLTREELELTEHFNTLALTGLLAGKEVKVGDSWPVPKNVVEALCALEGLVGHDLTCKLEEVKNDVAHVKVTGSVDGIDLGVGVKMLIKAQYQFDLKAKRLISLTWQQSDDRVQGPVSPALVADVDIHVERRAIEQPAELNPIFLVGTLPPGKEPPPELTLIAFTDSAKLFEVDYSRDWIMTAHAREHTVWRLMNRGDLVAQATVVPWRKLPAGKMVSYAEFVAALARTQNWQEKQRIGRDGEDRIDVPHSNKAFRYAAAGTLEGLEVVQFFYVLAGPQGEHLLVTFTMNPNQVKDLDNRDVSFLRGISFLSGRMDSGATLDLQPVGPAKMD